MGEGQKDARPGSRTPQERDLACLLRIQVRDPRGLATLYDAYSPLLFSVVHRVLRGAAEAEDVLQEAWIQIWKQAGTYDPARGTVAAWLLTVARSRALDRYRSLASRKRAESGVDPGPSSSSPDPLASSAHQELHERITRALGTLSLEQREVLALAYFGGLSQSQIAERLRAPLGTVKSWTRQGLMRLREQLPREEGM